MSVFISKGDEPLSMRQAVKRGEQVLALELSRAGARPGDRDILAALPHGSLPNRLVTVLTELGVDTWIEYASNWETINSENGANNVFNHHLFAYRRALDRLAYHRLADGRPKQEIGTGMFDKNGDEVIEVIPSIAPLPAMIKQPVYDPETGKQTGTEVLPNPEVVKDDAERAAACAVIETTSQAVKDFDNS